MTDDQSDQPKILADDQSDQQKIMADDHAEDTEAHSEDTEVYGFRCSNCEVNFDYEKEYIAHYKSDFHRFNVMRKVSGLPIVAYEKFMKWNTQNKERKKIVIPTTAPVYYCGPCSKKFTNEGTYNAHMQQKKHKQTVAKKQASDLIKERKISGSRKSSCVLDRGDPTEDKNACLFCNFLSESFEENL